MTKLKEMLSVIIGAIIIFILYKRYLNIYEEFSDNDIAFLKLNINNYPSIPTDHEFYNNPPVSDSGVLGVKSSGKYCNNNKIKTISKRGNQLNCGGMKKIINDFFKVNVNEIATKTKQRAETMMERVDDKVDNSTGKDLEEILERYKELKNDLEFKKRFLKENEINADKYKDSNKKLEQEVDDINYSTNKSMQTINTLKKSYDENKEKMYTLHKYTKYTLLLMSFVTIVYLFGKDVKYSVSNNNLI